MNPVFLNDVLGDLSKNIEGEFPGYRLQGPSDPQHRMLKPISGGVHRIVPLLRNGPTSDTEVSGEIHCFSVCTGMTMIWCGFPLAITTLCWFGAWPLSAQDVCRKIFTKGVLTPPKASLFTQRPPVRFVTTGYDTIITGGGEDLSILWWQRYSVFGRGQDLETTKEMSCRLNGTGAKACKDVTAEGFEEIPIRVTGEA